MSLKLVTLNVWGGRVREPILEYFSKNKDVDIFCLQEVYHNAPSKISDEDCYLNLNFFGEVSEILNNHTPYFRPVVNNIYGIGVLIKNTVTVTDEGQIVIYENKDYEGVGPRHSRIAQWVKCTHDGSDYVIVNVHGLWNGKGKKDSEDRIIQSKKIKEFVDACRAPVIICGDFNLEPNTDSLEILSSGMNDLIKENNITSTRTSFYEKDVRYADYIFTSDNVTVNKFDVIEDEVSDHNALELEFS